MDRDKFLADRMQGVGQISIMAHDTTDGTLRMKGIDDVKRVAGLIDSARRAERLRRGLSIETV